MRRWKWQRGSFSAGAALLLLGLTVALSACSTSDLGGTGIGLSGLGFTNLAPTGTPTLQGTDPGGRYAFVYGNQVWIKNAQDKAPHQLTHLALAAGTTYSWGPIVWSSNGSHIAFALGQSGQSAEPAAAGPLYIVDTSSGDAELTAGTSSVYGHTYVWYGANALFYANGTGVQYYDFSDPGDPRPFQAVVGGNGPDYAATGNPHFITYGDIAFVGKHLYVTRIDVAALGGTAAVGTAKIWDNVVPTAASAYSGGSMNISSYGPMVDLGQAYADSSGNVVAGSWDIAQDGGSVFDQVTGVDAKAGTIKGSVCYASRYNPGGCDQNLFEDVSTYPLDARPQLAFSNGGKTIAFGGPNVSTETLSGTGFVKLSPGSIGQPPQWSPDNSSLAATQPAAQSGSGASQQQGTTNIVIYAAGKSSVLIAGAQGLSWSPQ